MFKKLLLVVGGVLTSLLLAEVFIRLLPTSLCQYGFERFVLTEKEQKDYVDPINAHYRGFGWYLYRPSSIPGLGYEMIPGALSSVSVNKYGMVGREYPLKKGPDTYRILLLGDSIIQEHSFAAFLEEMLNSSGMRRRFEIWNAGVGGYQINQYAAYLRHKGLKFHPDMVIVNFGLNDFDIHHIVFYKTKNGVVGHYDPATLISEKVPVNKFLLLNSYLYRFLITRLQVLVLRHEKGAASGVKGKRLTESEQGAEGRCYLRTMADLCREAKVPLVGVVFPYLKPFADYAEWQMLQYVQIFGSLRALKIEHIDLSNHLPEEQRSGFRAADDEVHLSPKGYKIAAQAVSNYLLSNQLTHLK